MNPLYKYIAKVGVKNCPESILKKLANERSEVFQFIINVFTVFFNIARITPFLSYPFQKRVRFYRFNKSDLLYSFAFEFITLSLPRQKEYERVASPYSLHEYVSNPFLFLYICICLDACRYLNNSSKYSSFMHKVSFISKQHLYDQMHDHYVYVGNYTN